MIDTNSVMALGARLVHTGNLSGHRRFLVCGMTYMLLISANRYKIVPFQIDQGQKVYSKLTHKCMACRNLKQTPKYSDSLLGM